MLLDVCLGTRSAWKILLSMAETPGKALSRKQIQEQTKIGNKVLVKFIAILKKFEIVQETKLGRQYFYKMNLANPFTNQILGIIQLEKQQLNNPYFTTAGILREFVYELTNVTGFEDIQKVILFGSVAKHTATLTSDIDVAIILKEKNPRIELQVTAVCGQIEDRFSREIQPHYFTGKEFEELKKRKNKLVLEIARDGIVLA